MLPPLTAFAVLCLVPAADTKPAGYPRADLLIEAAELAKPADGLLVLDARPKEKYQAGHVPGAVWVDHDTWSKKFAEGQDSAVWTKLIGVLGITGPETRVVIYDDNLSKDAARIWWVLRYWGVKDVRLLNGGWKAWDADGRKVEKTNNDPRAVEARLTPQSERLATKEQILAALKDKPPQLIDARSEGEFCGDAKTAKKNGAIPGALHLEWSDLLDRKTGKFKSAEEMTKLLKDAGIDPGKPATTYCQSGGRAAVMAFALELMGGKDVRNYYRSWSEWGNADDTIIVKPKK
jgi:thiosulfate/3-mercaptopyruvate sulfurtransferase